MPKNRSRFLIGGTLFWLVLVSLASCVDSFSVRAPITRHSLRQQLTTTPSIQSTLLYMSSTEDEDTEQVKQKQQVDDLDNMELAWRHAKKPLLRIGSKGATLTHGNSLRQLLESHTVVKVKINTGKFGMTYFCGSTMNALLV